MHEKISIIMPVKNTGDFLADCIRSVLSQDYPHWQLIAVDDHSTDESPLLIAALADADARISLLRNAGNGIIDALHTGYRASDGAYITRMDSDDIMPDHKLSSMLAQLRDSGTGYIATGLVQYFSDTGLGQGYLNYENWLNNLSSHAANFTELYRECPIPSPCWMVHREDFDRAGAFSHDMYPEDYDLCFRFYRQGLQMLPAKEVLHHWRDHSQRSSRTHEHYADNSFISIKMHYFLLLHYDADLNLVLWGAGAKAKKIAKILIENDTPFEWVCNNPNKIGREIYGVFLQDSDLLSFCAGRQLLLTMANKEEQTAVNRRLVENNMVLMKNIFWMC